MKLFDIENRIENRRPLDLTEKKNIHRILFQHKTDAKQRGAKGN